MKAQYLLRLDDAHPEMNHDNWSIIEQMCIQYNVKPIVAIIPDNKDSNIVYQTYDDTFWGTARKWQEIGWSIAIHGLNHKLTKSGAGLVGINNYSEFVGVDQSIQDSMIYNAYMILSRKGLAPSVWVAPAHGLDMKTLNSLLAMTPVRVISDGLSMFPYDKYGMQWIPQQLWRPRVMPFGVWTICLHPSEMTDTQINDIRSFISHNKHNFIAVSDVSYSKASLFSGLFSRFYLFLLMIKKTVRVNCALK